MYKQEDKLKLSIILPTKNEVPTIGNTIKSIYEHSKNWDVEIFQIIVVDNGSSDTTANIAENFKSRVIRRSVSGSNGAAIKTGARAASREILVFMDADGQHNASDIGRLLNKLNEGYDTVVGARQKGSQASWGRGLDNKLYNWLASYITGHRVKDLTSGFRAVRADKFKEFLYLLPNGFSYPTTSTMVFFRADYLVSYIPIYAFRRIGKSHIKFLRNGVRFFNYTQS